MRARPTSWLTPARLLALSFLGLIAFGTAGLLVLPGLYTGPRLSVLDALFTATSAVCVTGLIVVDTATFFTPWGQAFLLLLIQLGGLGMLTFATLIVLSIGRRLTLQQEAVAASAREVAPHLDIRHLTRTVVLFTFLVEAAGALLLFLAWVTRMPPLAALGHAVFHAISAFCNAGFSTFSDSLVGFRTAPITLILVMALIVVGGIGFITVEEVGLWTRARRARRPFRLSLHSQVVLVVTAFLLVAGWALFAVSEWTGTLAGLPLVDRSLNALFMSVTARTAGFNTIDHAFADTGTNFLTIVLMAIGGSPGSTAGGLKTTTFAVIGLLAWSRLVGLRTCTVAGRSIPEETVERAVGLFVFVFGVVTAAILLLGFTEPSMGAGAGAGRGGPFLAYMFEAVSAFNTVGLSMGVTDDLSPAGRVIAIVLMYVGRVGPLTFGAAIALRPTMSRNFRYAYENVGLG
jgi:trk system potassium uptake protein TrkH